MKPLDITKPCETDDEYEHTFDLGVESRILFVVTTDRSGLEPPE